MSNCGVSMYSAPSYLTKKRGLDEVFEKLMNIAVDELRHGETLEKLIKVLNKNVNNRTADLSLKSRMGLILLKYLKKMR